MALFSKVYIEISNICNIQCSFCPVVEREKQMMSLEQFKHVLLQAKPYAKEICLHLMGEPLAHPKIKEILTICDEENVQVQITTNGLLIKRYQDILVRSRCLRQINFSLQSYKDNFPHKDLRQYLIPILGFTLLLQQKRPEVYVNLRLWNVDASDNENEEVFQELEKFYEIEIKRSVDVGHIKSKRIWNRVYLHFDSRFEWPDMSLPNQGEQGRCHGLINQLGIHTNGTVVPCCLDKEAQIDLGNVFEKSLEDILNSSRAIAIKEGFQNNRRVEKLCQHCSYITRFTKKEHL